MCTICTMLQLPRCSLHRRNSRVLVSPEPYCRACCVRIVPTRRQQACDQNILTEGLGQNKRASRKPVGVGNALPQTLQPVLASTLARDAAAATAELIAGTLLVKIFDFLQYSGVMEKRVSRKWVHVLAGPGLMAFWPLYSNAPYARFFAALCPALNMFRLVLIGTGSIKDEGTVNAISREGDRRELLGGPLYYAVVLLAATIVYWRDSPIGVTAVAVMSGGDGLADLVGRKYGAAKLPYNHRKSWAGSIAMLLGGWALAVAFIAFFQHLGLFECTLTAIAASVGGISAAAAILESLPVNQYLDDNLSVPILAALLGQLLFARGTLLIA